MAIAATEVKKLREATGAGMMDAKRALEEVDGDFDKAMELLRVKGATKAAKRGAERTAANGLVATSGTALVELNCETDFVAKNETFQQLGACIVEQAANSKATDAQTLAASTLTDGQTVQQAVDAQAAVIGEKLALGRVAVFEGQTQSYLHRRSPDLPAQIGVLVQYQGQDAALVKSVAMHIAAMAPQYLTREEIPAEVIEQERRVAEATSREEGKPEQAIPKIVEGRMNGFYKDVVLTEQASAHDQSMTIGTMLNKAGVKVTAFARIEVGN